jgi:hypothetical protein
LRTEKNSGNPTNYSANTQEISKIPFFFNPGDFTHRFVDFLFRISKEKRKILRILRSSAAQARPP